MLPHGRSGSASVAGADFTAFSQVPYSAIPDSEPTQGVPTKGEAVTAPTNSQTASGTTAHYPQMTAEPGSPAAGPPAAAPPRRGSAQVVALVAAGALLGGTGGVAAGVALRNDSPGTSAALGGSSAPVVSPSGMSTGRSTSAVAAAVLPSVVVLQVSGSGRSDTGSGVVLSGDGYLLTNNHVVTAASSGGTIRATFNDGTSAAARIIGTDPASDLAVVKVARSGLRAATLGSSATLKVGDPVLAHRQSARTVRHCHVRHRVRARPAGQHRWQLRRGQRRCRDTRGA